MRRCNVQSQMLGNLGWYLAGFVLVQAGLAVSIEGCWPSVRDPEFCEILGIVRERRAEHPGGPLVLTLGSSRTHMALATDCLNATHDADAPVVINAAVLGSGPIMQHVALRRLLEAGIRPDVVFVETIPFSVSARDGAAIEERQRYQGRFTFDEVVWTWPYYGEPSRLWLPWLKARLLPCDRFQAELRDALGIDLPDGPSVKACRHRFGSASCPVGFSAEKVAACSQEILNTYESALCTPKVLPGVMASLRDIVQRCRQERIAVVFLVPAETSAFHGHAPHVEEAHLGAIRGLADELMVPVIDARTWVDDDGFCDGIHVIQRGADQFTARFSQEALAPAIGLVERSSQRNTAVFFPSSAR